MGKPRKILDRTYNDTWEVRTKKLKGKPYQDYLKSDHWKKLKNKARSLPAYKKCTFCNSMRVDLHHMTYRWIYTSKELSSIISLCRKHHKDVHDLAKTKRISVYLATIRLRKKYTKK